MQLYKLILVVIIILSTIYLATSYIQQFRFIYDPYLLKFIHLAIPDIHPFYCSLCHIFILRLFFLLQF